ncbi:N2,N2-dimethylguanosine tRNA methyltransferase [Verruconis gallopava]|uniref:tRNA (guanine(26)-N(2))-dimethyltransferase n=1 Tax=Verruconis gallopava TaxID=253628 RepID=A0A0D1Z5P4_9PEZI|nr:N2,N2-dimethylguanosine tRNA methyltransferase [Verruconis gallopava]KIW08292.1 N2,N2-dimethylguanosine tRNA methyltransferase [Verruconis gallopava]
MRRFHQIFQTTIHNARPLSLPKLRSFENRSRPRYTMMATAKPKTEPESAPVTNAAPVDITAPPADGQTVQHGDKTYTTVQEGLAYILIPPDTPRLLDPKTHANEPSQSVFYNPIQQYNRDLTVLAIRAFGEDLLVRQAWKSKKRRGKRGGQSSKDGKKENDTTAGDNAVSSADAVVENTEESLSMKSAQTAESTKRKLDDNSQGDVERKKQKLTSEAAEFEDGGINDDDLLAVESSMAENMAFSTSRETEGVEKKTADGSTDVSQAPVEDQDTRTQFRILDALSATGLRALRYAKELPFNTLTTANDISRHAVEAIKLNVKHNRLEKKIKTSVGNANAHMYSFVAQEGVGGPGSKYHVIDLDPYGTAVPFLDAAVQAVSDNGMLCVTCTDTGVFNSVGYAEKAFALYGGIPARGDYCHEAGLRLILHSIAATAAKYGIAIEPLVSLSIDYYARVFVRVKKSPADVKFLASKTMLVYACDHGCGSWTPQFIMRSTEQQGKKGAVYYKYTVAQGPTSDRLCECCGSKMHIVGPMWGGPLHNPSFIQKILDMIPNLDADVYKTLPRIEGMLSVAQEELAIQELAKLTVPNEVPKQQRSEKRGQDEESSNGKDNAQAQDTLDSQKHLFESLNTSVVDRHPFYVVPSALSRVLHCQAPSDAEFRGALKSLGYQAVRSHALPGTIKTDAPWEAIWDIMIAWTKLKPIREGALKEGMAGYQIMKRGEEREKASLDAEKERSESENDSSVVGAIVNKEAAPRDSDSKDVISASRGRKIVFDEKLGREPVKSKRMVRYQLNPRANWGPMARAK